MTLVGYSAYRDTAIDWIGRIPAHWRTPAMYTRYRIQLGKMLDTKRLTGTHEVPYLRNTDVQWDTINTVDLPVMDIEPSERDRFTVRRGDLLVCEGGDVGRTAVWHGDDGTFGFQKALHRLRALSAAEHPRFMCYTMRFASASGALIAEGNPNTIPHLTGERFRLYRFPTPPIEEQRAIAEFLDRETAKIDALVAEQERLMALLREKRQAVISHAVTKGLTPVTPMKASEIEWLGDIPAAWEVSPVSRLVTSIEQGWSPQCENRPAEATEWGILKVGCVNGDVFDASEQKALPPGLDPELRYEVTKGDILVSRGNTLDLVASACVVGEVRPGLLLSDLLYRLRAEPRTSDPHFLVLQMRAGVGRFQIESAATGTSPSMKKINQGALRSLVFPTPPVDEQRLIVSVLREVTQELDVLITAANAAICLLVERRAALITAAVTGQIDVRPLATANAA